MEQKVTFEPAGMVKNNGIGSGGKAHQNHKKNINSTI